MADPPTPGTRHTPPDAPVIAAAPSNGEPRGQTDASARITADSGVPHEPIDTPTSNATDNGEPHKPIDAPARAATAPDNGDHLKPIHSPARAIPEPAGGERHAWIDASAGVAGDMLLGALLDAGAALGVVRTAIEAVQPGAVRVDVAPVRRAGLHALRVTVATLIENPPRRDWAGIRALLGGATLADRVRERALAVFARLAEAEAEVHGIAADDVHFHEVGAWDSIADVVGVCAALEDLRIGTLSASPVAVGSGRVRTAHGDLPVPVPAVTRLARGWRIDAGGSGELATPTGMAIIRALATRCEALPPMRLDAAGTGAGGRDVPGRANVVRVLIGIAPTTQPDAEPVTVLAANVDDLDPRLWPGVLAGLLDAGALDAWLVPILMKKGRPAHTLTALCRPGRADELRDVILRGTSTLGVRSTAGDRVALRRGFVDVAVAGATVAVKIGHRDGLIVQATPEFADVTALAARLGRPERSVLQAAASAAAAAGLTPGAAVPPALRGPDV
jgi:uncharacterized protein (TIGR00299 family) protein